MKKSKRIGLLTGTAIVVTLLLAFLLPARVVVTSEGRVSMTSNVAYAMTGSGAEGDPWIIWDIDDLQAIESNLGDWYELGQDIDASATETWNGGAGFIPITAFTGHLDGKGFVISDIFIINDVDRNKQHALFYSNAGTVQNLGVEGATVRGDEKSGILAGVSTGTIQRCYVTGTLDKAASGSKGKNLGGLVGNNKGTVTDCYAIVDITGNEKSGGITGKQEAGTVTNVYAVGVVTAGATAFGFNGEIKNIVEGTFVDGFWDTDVGPATDAAAGQLSEPTGDTTANMYKEATYTNWDFVDTWEIEEDTGYPTLQVFAGAGPDISNAPASKGFEVVAESSSYWSKGSTPTFPLDDGECFFEVTNNSSGSIDIEIKATNFTGGVGWTLAGSVGENDVVMKAGKSGDANEGAMLTLTTGDQLFIDSLADTASMKWEIKLATGTFTDGAEKTSTITLTATLE